MTFYYREDEDRDFGYEPSDEDIEAFVNSLSKEDFEKYVEEYLEEMSESEKNELVAQIDDFKEEAIKNEFDAVVRDILSPIPVDHIEDFEYELKEFLADEIEEHYYNQLEAHEDAIAYEHQMRDDLWADQAASARGM